MGEGDRWERGAIGEGERWGRELGEGCDKKDMPKGGDLHERGEGRGRVVDNGAYLVRPQQVTGRVRVAVVVRMRARVSPTPYLVRPQQVCRQECHPFVVQIKLDRRLRAHQRRLHEVRCGVAGEVSGGERCGCGCG